MKTNPPENKPHLLAVAVLAMLFFACGSGKDFKPVYKAVDTLNMTRIRPDTLGILMTKGCRDIIDFGDCLLILADMDGKILHLFDKDGRVVVSAGHVGRGPGEFLTINNAQKTGPRTFSLYDPQRKSVSHYNIDSLLSGRTQPEKECEIIRAERCLSVNAVYQAGMDKSVYIAGAGVYSENAPRMAKVSRSDSTVVYFDRFPPSDDPVRMILSYHQLPLVGIDAEKGKMLVANTPYGAVIEIFDISGDRFDRTDIKYIVEPVFGHTKGFIDNLDETIAGFIDMYATDEHIVASYVGASPKSYPRTKLVMLDWEGNVKKTYATDFLNAQIAYDHASNAVFSVSMLPSGELALLRYDLVSK